MHLSTGNADNDPAERPKERMMPPNINPNTGIRYGVISSNGLDPEIFQDLWDSASDPQITENPSEEYRCPPGECDECDNPEGNGWEQCEHAMDRFLSDDMIDWPNTPREGNSDGVHYTIDEFGGGYLVWICMSPHIADYPQCSPCVPGAGDLDGERGGGVQCYDVPDDWR